MTLSKIQKKIVEATEKYIIVNSCAGSGKTRTLTERVKYLLSKGVPADKIVVITFTNAAANTMRERIGEAPGLHCSTVHSYANQLLRKIQIDTSHIINNENFDELFEMIKDHPECIQEVDYLLLDEGQDSTDEQFEFMLDIVNPKNWMIFSDHRQSIFRFAGARPQYIITLIESPEVTTYDLNENFRNGYTILDYAKSLIAPLGYKYRDKSIAVKESAGKVVTVECSFSGIAKTILKRVQKGVDKYSDWFILTRTNGELSSMRKVLKDYGIPSCTFKRARHEINEFEEKMAEDSVKVITIHTAKGLEAKNVAVIGANFLDEEERCLSYVAATRAEDLLVWTYTKRCSVFSKKGTKQEITVSNWE